MNRFRWVAFCIASVAILTFTQFPYAATLQTRVDYAAALERIYDTYRNARAQCAPLAGHDRDVCAVAAQAAERRSKAVAEVNYKGTIKSKSDSAIADADADLMVARVACGTRIAGEKSACVNEAKAVNVKLVAEATEKYAK
jgi:hypothetical protein